METNNHMGIKEKESEWLPILDFAMQKGMSISTVRRYIKANKLVYQIVDGKYFVAGDSETTSSSKKLNASSVKIKKNLEPMNSFLKKDKIKQTLPDSEILFHQLKEENELLRKKVRRLSEERDEMKMLMELYEKGPIQSKKPANGEYPPDLPNV